MREKNQAYYERLGDKLFWPVMILAATSMMIPVRVATPLLIVATVLGLVAIYSCFKVIMISATADQKPVRIPFE
jgi:hypothetical protein